MGHLQVIATEMITAGFDRSTVLDFTGESSTVRGNSNFLKLNLEVLAIRLNTTEFAKNSTRGIAIK